MTEFDADLVSIQEARDLAQAAQAAQKKWAHATQEEVDRVCAAMAAAGEAAAERLGQMANQETGYGVPAHKTLKNLLCSRILWEEIKDIKTVGVIGRDEKRGLVQIAWPMGVVAALIPSTNPTSTAYFKIMIAVKAFVMMMLGGAGTVLGPVLGAFLIELISETVWGKFLTIHMLILGIIMVAIVILMPRGIMAFFRKKVSLATIWNNIKNQAV